MQISQPRFKSLKEATEVSAVRLTDERRFARVGDIFRLSPYPGLFLWGRLIKKSRFFGLDALFNLVYIYDAVSIERPPAALLTPENLLIGPAVVNNLGWVRGYWQIVASEKLKPEDVLAEHQFVRFRGTGNPGDYDIVGEHGQAVRGRPTNLRAMSQSGFGNFNSVDWKLKGILKQRGLIPESEVST
jgi:hypothetical protein